MLYSFGGLIGCLGLKDKSFENFTRVLVLLRVYSVLQVALPPTIIINSWITFVI